MNTRRPLTLQTPLVATDVQVSADLAERTAILNIDSGKYYGLDDVGREAWRLFQAPCSIAGVCDLLLRDYAVPRATLERDVLALALDLMEAGLLRIVGTTAD